MRLSYRHGLTFCGLLGLSVFLAVTGPARGQTNTPSDNGEIERLLKAPKTDPLTQYKLGQLYANGLGLPMDFDKAFDCFKRSANLGNPDAQYSLGFCYAIGMGAKPSKSDAYKWYLKSAKQTNSQAQFKVAVCLEKGLGVTQNSADALKWYRQAAENGVGEAQFIIGEKAWAANDYREALTWFNSAARRGVAQAQLRLGVCHRDGQGVDRNYVEAYKWFLIAASNGCESAHDLISDMNKLKSYNMDAEKIALAERKAQEAPEFFKPIQQP